jgi:hypothetical protein
LPKQPAAIHHKIGEETRNQSPPTQIPTHLRYQLPSQRRGCVHPPRPARPPQLGNGAPLRPVGGGGYRRGAQAGEPGGQLEAVEKKDYLLKIERRFTKVSLFVYREDDCKSYCLIEGWREERLRPFYLVFIEEMTNKAINYIIRH